MMESARYYLWAAWDRARYYWPRAKSRRRAEAMFRAYYAEHGISPKPSRPWWLP